MSSPTPTWKQEVRNLTLALIGAACIGAAISFFLQPGQIIIGGTPGMGLLLNHLTEMPTGLAMLCVNIPLLLLGIRFVDMRFALRTVFTMVFMSVFVDVFNAYLVFHPTEHPLLICLYGGASAGLGIGLILKGGASAGGTTIIARILSRHTRFKPGQLILIADACIIGSAGLIIKDAEKVLWAILCTYAIIRVVDYVLTMAIHEKTAQISTRRPEALGAAIRAELGRDGSIISGHNLSADEDKNMMFVLIDPRQLPQLRQLVQHVDPDAIMVIMDAQEIMGARRIRR